MLLLLFTKAGDVVIDTTAGVGNMARACVDLRRHCISIDMDPKVHEEYLIHIGQQWEIPQRESSHPLPRDLTFDSTFMRMVHDIPSQDILASQSSAWCDPPTFP